MTITKQQADQWQTDVDYWRKKYADLGLQYDTLIKRAEDLEVRLGTMMVERSEAFFKVIQENEQLQRDFTYIKQRRDALLVAMEKLARLGNGDMYGNSEGNQIAIAALNGANAP